MKDKMKNTLEQEVELLGRSVSVLLIAGLLVVGGASAALLSSFGTVDGQADVTQSVYVGNSALSDADTESIFDATSDEDGSIVAGESVIGTTTIENRGDLPVPVDFTSSGDYTEDGVDYEYALLDTFAVANNTAETDNSASTEVVRTDDGFGVKATAEIDSVSDDEGETSAVAGVLFDVDSDTSPDSASVTVDYTVGDEDTNPADVDAEGPEHHGPDWFTVQFETEGGETYTAIDPAAYAAEDGGKVTMSDDTPVIDDGDADSTVSEYSGADVTAVGVSTGSERSAPEGTFQLIYDEVRFEETDLIREKRTYEQTSGNQVETIDLQPDTEYDFTGFMDTSVYTQPNTDPGYSVSTELDVESQTSN